MKLHEWLKLLNGKKVRFTRKYLGNMRRQCTPDPEPLDNFEFTIDAKEVLVTERGSWNVSTGHGIYCYNADPQVDMSKGIARMAFIIHEAPSGNFFHDEFALID